MKRRDVPQGACFAYGAGRGFVHRHGARHSAQPDRIWAEEPTEEIGGVPASHADADVVILWTPPSSE